MRVLYVSHTGLIGGAERSLLELIGALPPEVEAVLACPDTDLAREARGLGIQVLPIEGTEISFRLRSRGTPRALALMASTAAAVRHASRTHRSDVIHANSARAGLAVSLGTGLPPFVVHIRDVLPEGRTATVARRVLLTRAAAVIANSQFTAAAFAPPHGHGVGVLYPSVNARRFDPTLASRSEARRRYGLDNNVPVLGVVAQLTPWKAQHDAIDAFIRLRRRFPNAVLLLAGDAKFTAATTRFDNAAYARSLRERAAHLGDAVRFLGSIDDVPELLSTLDLLLLPSVQEPFGRAALEAMAMGVPTVATSVGGTAELIENGVDGLLLPPGDPTAWADACVELLASESRRAEFAARGQAKAASFSPEGRAIEAVDIYTGVIRGATRRLGTAITAGRA
jgi:glycosyltransferase involved in cell wall biosynthesis